MGNFFKSKVFKGGLFLTIFGFLGKGLGAIFKIGLSALVGSFGMGIYQLVFPLLVFFIVLSSEGFSLALTIKTAEDKSKQKHYGYFVLSLVYTFIFSIVSAGVITIFAKQLSILQGGRINSYLYYIVAVGVVVISLLSVLKAKIRGEERFKLYSLAEILEDLFKVVLGLILGWSLLDFGVEIAIAGVFVGIISSSLLTVIFLLFFRQKKNTQLARIPLSQTERKEYFKFSLVALGSALIMPAIQFIESAIILKLLTNGTGISSILATKLYGLSRGSVSAIINLPFFLLSSFEVLLLPNLSRAKNGGIYYKKTELSLFLAMFISIPFVLLFTLFSTNVVSVLYGGSLTSLELNISANLLRLGAVGIIFASISTILAVILNSNNKVKAPLFASIIAGVVKILFLILFVPKLNIYAVELSSVIFSMVVCLVNLLFAVKYKCFTKPKNVLKMALGWGIVFLSIWFVNKLFLTFVSNAMLACVFAFLTVGILLVVIFGVVYLFNKQKVQFVIKKMFGAE